MHQLICQYICLGCNTNACLVVDRKQGTRHKIRHGFANTRASLYAAHSPMLLNFLHFLRHAKLFGTKLVLLVYARHAPLWLKYGIYLLF